MRTSMEALDMLANNLANSQTSGYKGDGEFYDLYTSPDASEGAVQMPDLPQNWTDYSQGTLQQTANQLDLAISGEGFFSIEGTSGTLFTRNGGFRLSATGKLVTQEGYGVKGSDGKTIQLDPNQPISVDARGDIMQSGAQVAQLQLASFKDMGGLAKQGASYFQFRGQQDDIKTGSGAIQQGKLENSNVAPANSVVRLVSVMRQFEMLQKAVSIGSDMNKEAIEDVARSGQ